MPRSGRNSTHKPCADFPSHFYIWADAEGLQRTSNGSIESEEACVFIANIRCIKREGSQEIEITTVILIQTGVGAWIVQRSELGKGPPQ